VKLNLLLVTYESLRLEHTDPKLLNSLRDGSFEEYIVRCVIKKNGGSTMEGMNNVRFINQERIGWLGNWCGDIKRGWEIVVV
jgi:hypothetical protein